MKKYLLSSILLLGVIAGCDKETPGNDSNTGEGSGATQELTFDASFDNTAYKKTWESTDAILIMADDGTVIESVIAEADAAEFSGTLPQSESYYALYPAECNASFNNGKIMASIPGEQLAASSGSSLGSCFLAAESSPEDLHFVFKEITGYISFSIPEGTSGIAKIEIKASENEALTGDFTVTLSNNTPSVGLGSTTGATLTVKPKDGNEFGVGTYICPVLPGSKANGLTVTAFNTEGETVYSKPTAAGLSMNIGSTTDLGEIKIADGEFSISNIPVLPCSLSDEPWQLGVIPENTQVTWTSSDQEVATVDAAGKVTFLKYGQVTISASDGKTTKEAKFEIPAGYYRDTFGETMENSKWALNADHVGKGAEQASLWSELSKEWCINITPFISKNIGRGDIKRTGTTYLSRNYPILCFRFDDVNDRKVMDNGEEKAPTRYINIDTDSEDKSTYRGDIGGSNNKWWKKYKCTDGSSIFIYNLDEQTFSKTGKQLPEDGTPETFILFQIKYADINRGESISSLNAADINYRLFWFYSFQTETELNTFLEKWSDESGVEYSE